MASASASVPNCHADTPAAYRATRSASAARHGASSEESSTTAGSDSETAASRPASRNRASSRSNAVSANAPPSLIDARTRPAPTCDAAAGKSSHPAADRSGATPVNRRSAGTARRSSGRTATDVRAAATGSPPRVTFNRASYHPGPSGGSATADSPDASRAVCWYTARPPASATDHCPISSSSPAPPTTTVSRGASDRPNTFAARPVPSASVGARVTDRSSNHALPRMSCANPATPGGGSSSLSGCSSATSSTRNFAAGSAVDTSTSSRCHASSPPVEAKGSDRATGPTGLPVASSRNALSRARACGSGVVRTYPATR